MREDETDQRSNGSETSDGWTDAVDLGHNNDQQGRFQKCIVDIPPIRMKDVTDNLADISFSSNDRNETPNVHHRRLPSVDNITEAQRALTEQLYEELLKPSKARYQSKRHIFLCSTEELKKRMAAIEKQKGQIKPKQLSTMTTAKDIHQLTTGDLINSITEICRIRSPFLHSIRMSDLGYYNWVLVDLCRRMEVVHQRFNRDYKNHTEKEIRNQIINVIVDFDNVKYYIEVKGAFKMVRGDGDFFDLFPPFVAQKRTQILRIASIIGDEICAFTEFIDMKEIGDMDPDEYSYFLNDLKLSKHRLKEAIDTLQDANVFHGDPTSSYNRVELLNEKVPSHDCAYQIY